MILPFRSAMRHKTVIVGVSREIIIWLQFAPHIRQIYGPTYMYTRASVVAIYGLAIGIGTVCCHFCRPVGFFSCEFWKKKELFFAFLSTRRCVLALAFRYGFDIGTFRGTRWQSACHLYFASTTHIHSFHHSNSWELNIYHLGMHTWYERIFNAGVGPSPPQISHVLHDPTF